MSDLRRTAFSPIHQRVVGLAFLLCALSSSSQPIQQVTAINPLVIYTYDSFMYGYDIATEFSKSIGQNDTSGIAIYYLKSACLLDVLCPEGCLNRTGFDTVGIGCQGSDHLSYPAPDIILGFDLEQELSSSSVDSYLVPFNLSAQLVAELNPTVTSLGHFSHTKAVDFGLVGLTYNMSNLPELVSYSRDHTFNFETLFTHNLISQLVVENPTLDTSGLNFLLWTIAWYGDNSINLAGVAPSSQGDWRYFWWRALRSGISIASDWSTAFANFTSLDQPINLVSSYGSDPAYSGCTNTSGYIGSLITYDALGVAWGWAQIESAAITDHPHNLTLSELFLTWLSSPDFQEQLYLYQYMLPVNSVASEGANIPQCYNASSYLNPSGVQLLNTRLSADLLSRQLTPWLDVWTELVRDRFNSTLPPADSTPRSSSSTGGQPSSSTGVLSSASSLHQSTFIIIMLISSIIIGISW